MVSTPLKNISQIESFPQVGMKIKHIPNHHPENVCFFPRVQFPMPIGRKFFLALGTSLYTTKVRQVETAASMAPWLPKGLANCKGFYQTKQVTLESYQTHQLPSDQILLINPKVHKNNQKKMIYIQVILPDPD